MIGGLSMNISIIGMPLFYGCDKPGVEQGPKILRENNVIDIFAKKHNVIDLGNISVPSETNTTTLSVTLNLCSFLFPIFQQ